MKKLITSIATSLAISVLGVAQAAESEAALTPVTTERLLAGTSDTGSWLMYGGSYNNFRYSPLKQITPENIGKLVPVWMFQTGVHGQLSGSPVISDGIAYLTAPHNNLWAIDALTGDALWHYEHQMPGDLRICCGPINRGVAIHGDRLFMATLDAKLLAFDRSNGKVIWKADIANHADGYSATSAPLIVGDLVITGVGGGEYGARGFIDAYNAADGTLAWRTFTVPAAGEPGVETWAGDSWKTGGGPTWGTGTYDPQTNLIYWPTGNPSPDWNGDTRKGDNLYSNSLLALEPATGNMKWYFQYTPHDVWDFDATNGVIVGDLTIDGKKVRAVIQPNRNGFVYVLDAVNGAFLKGYQYTDRLNWAKGLDQNGRPVVDADYLPLAGGNDKFICPGNVGGNNGSYSYAYSPQSKLMFVPSIESCAKMVKESQVFVHGTPFWGGGPGVTEGETGTAYGRLVASDPATGEIKWKYRDDYPMLAGALATGGGVVFSGNQQGHALALDERDGKVLWRFPTGSAIRSQPITWEMDGEQYVAVLSGGGGIAAAIVGAPPLATLGGAMVVFKLAE